ncbi:MAG: SnoaL-like domain-containing protein [Halioglobus sp.]|nr:SnoaL-like domain-containing protein [Halioglobus sp.]
MSANAQIIDSFMAAWNAMDVDAVMDHFTEDAAYANIPMGPPHVGKEAIRAFIDGFMATTTGIDFIVHRQVDDGSGVVMNERTDKLVMDGRTVELPVMGVFELSDGKIAGWRDYFDMGAFT